jgi:hypothetical protein
MVIPSLIMLINSLLSPPSCDLKLINGKSLNKSKTTEPPTNNGLRAKKIMALRLQVSELGAVAKGV